MNFTAAPHATAQHSTAHTNHDVPQRGTYDPGYGSKQVKVAVKIVPVDDPDAQAALQVV